MSYPQMEKAVLVMKKLLENGEWEQQQTHVSLLKYLEEEVLEFKQAVVAGDKEEIKNELADIFLQVLFHAEIAAKNDDFGIEEVAESFIDKISSRSPEILVGEKLSLEAQTELWELRKQQKANLSWQESLIWESPIEILYQKISINLKNNLSGVNSKKLAADLEKIATKISNYQELGAEIKSELQDLIKEYTKS